MNRDTARPFRRTRRCFAASVSIPCRARGPTPSKRCPRSSPRPRSSRAAPTPSAAPASSRRPAPTMRPLARRVAGADLIRLRNQMRVLPTAAVNEALDVRLAEYRERMQEEPGRRTKRKLKEQTRDELLPKALLKSDRTTALFLLNENVLAVGTASEQRAERFLELLRIGARQARRRAADVRAADRERPGARVRRRSAAEIRAGARGRMRDRADAKSSVRWSEIDLTHANVRRCVKDGMELTHLGIQFDSALSGVLDAKGTLGKLKLRRPRRSRRRSGRRSRSRRGSARAPRRRARAARRHAAAARRAGPRRLASRPDQTSLRIVARS